MEGWLPAEVIWRRKAGFGAPIQSWISNELRFMVEELLGESYLKQQGIFRPEAVRALLKAEQSHEDYYANHIWQLLVFQLWHRTFIDSGVDADVPTAA
jgi:asparagine synthase (glutamine-hydrolysing)